jgi:hypothetical protein
MPSARASSFIDAGKGLAPRIQASAEEIEQSRRLPSPLGQLSLPSRIMDKAPTSGGQGRVASG